MNERIINKLKEIELKENVRILFAVESGSRAWGFESPDSDYDVRFVYVRKENDYLKLNTYRDVIEWELDDVYDINGWDLQKALKLLRASNPALFEWLNSPIVYITSPEHEELRKIAEHYVDTKKIAFHYIHTASNNYRNYLRKEEVKLKKYFYAIRPILAERYVLATQEIPPVLFEKLMDSQLKEEDIKKVVMELLARKKVTSELGFEKPNECLDLFIKNEIEKLKKQANNLDSSNFTWDELNAFFIKVLEKQ